MGNTCGPQQETSGSLTGLDEGVGSVGLAQGSGESLLPGLSGFPWSPSCLQSPLGHSLHALLSLAKTLVTAQVP